MQTIIAEAFALHCEHCGTTLEASEYELDKTGRGFWCEVCDAYNYFPLIASEERHRFELYLERSSTTEPKTHTGIRLNARLSPLRYPGGKSKLIPHAFARLNPEKTDLWVEPYAGGASVGLSLLEAGVVKRLWLNDLDFGVFALFKTIFTDPQPLLERIDTITPSREMFFEAQQRVLRDHAYSSIVEAAWDMLLVNRLSYSGIAKARPLGGKQGPQSALLSRWNPSTLTKRINLLRPLSSRVDVTHQDALEVIEEGYWNERATLFIDPPYVVKGPALYHRYYENGDHFDLRCLVESLYSTCPGADMQLYYDDSDMVRCIYSIPEFIEIARKYSA